MKQYIFWQPYKNKYPIKKVFDCMSWTNLRMWFKTPGESVELKIQVNEKHNPDMLNAFLLMYTNYFWINLVTETQITLSLQIPLQYQISNGNVMIQKCQRQSTYQFGLCLKSEFITFQPVDMWQTNSHPKCLSVFNYNSMDCALDSSKIHRMRYKK